MQNDASDIILKRCTFADNVANVTGALGTVAGTSIMHNCFFTNNEATTAGALSSSNQGDIQLFNCTFVGNKALLENDEGGWAGAIAVADYGQANITNCTFSANYAARGGGALYISNQSAVDLSNAILWANTAQSYAQFYINNSSVNVTRCCIQNGNTDPQVITDDPLFVDIDGPDNILGNQDDNLRLAPRSSCIDAGDNNLIPADSTDLDDDGNTVERVQLDAADETRVVNGNTWQGPFIDVGAYEYQADCNGNSILDILDIEQLTSLDCQMNGIPDECEIIDNDCNGDDIPDDCQLDGNDCNENSSPDDCDIAMGNSIDCNLNNIPDECEETTLIAASGDPQDVDICSNGEAVFSVQSDNDYVDYQWYFDGLPLADITGVIEGVNQETLHVYNATDAEEGNYYCEVSLDGCIYKNSDSAQLGIILDPIIRSSTAPVDTCNGGTALLKIDHDGDQELYYNYIWRKDGMPLSIQPNGKRLNLQDVTLDDTGEYTCEVISEICGISHVSPIIYLDVVGARFTTQPASQCRPSSEAAIFNMAAQTSGTITAFCWQRWYGAPYNRWINVNLQAGDSIQPLIISPPLKEYLYRGGVYVDNACWSYTRPVELVVGSATADLDSDGDIDLADFGAFAACFESDSDKVPECTCADLDPTDPVINQNDWYYMEQLFTGP